MAKGDTRAPTRQTFNDEAPPMQAQTGPRRMRYRCFANGCPMPGTIFPGGADSGVCAWHYGCNGSEIAVVSRALGDWDCLVQVVNGGRELLTGPSTAADVKALREGFERLWADLAGSVAGSGWKVRVEPRKGEDVGAWVRRMERFLKNRCKEALLGGNPITDDDAPTPTVADMRSRVRGALPSTLGGWE